VASVPLPPPIVGVPVTPPSRVPERRSGPSIVGRDDSVLVGDLVINVRSEPRVDSRGRVIDYSVRLARRDGVPVTDASVVLRGQTPDGTTVEAALDRVTLPGVYESAVILPAAGLHRLSLRITRPDTAVELPMVPVPTSSSQPGTAPTLTADDGRR
jgi:hypothetical protein